MCIRDRINEAAPPRSFLAGFQRWEWLLVAVIFLVVYRRMPAPH